MTALSLQFSLESIRLPLKALVCNASVLGGFLVGGDADSTQSLQQGLCVLPSSQLRAMEGSFLSQMDFPRLLAVSPQRGRVLEGTDTETPGLPDRAVTDRKSVV